MSELAKQEVIEIDSASEKEGSIPPVDDNKGYPAVKAEITEPTDIVASRSKRIDHLLSLCSDYYLELSCNETFMNPVQRLKWERLSNPKPDPVQPQRDARDHHDYRDQRYLDYNDNYEPDNYNWNQRPYQRRKPAARKRRAYKRKPAARAPTASTSRARTTASASKKKPAPPKKKPAPKVTKSQPKKPTAKPPATKPPSSTPRVKAEPGARVKREVVKKEH